MSQESFSTDGPYGSESVSNVMGMHEQLNPGAMDMGRETEFDRACADLINRVLGGSEERATAALTALAAFAEVPGIAPLNVDGKENVLKQLQATVQSTVIGDDIDKVVSMANSIVLAASQGAEQDSTSMKLGGGARRRGKRGGGPEEEAAVDVAAQAVAAAVQGNQQPLTDIEGIVVNAVAPVVAQSEKAVGIAPGAVVDPAQANAEADADPRVRLAVAGAEGIVQGVAVRTTLQTVRQGLSCAGGNIAGGGAWIIERIRAAAGASVYQVRQRVASFTAGIVALGTWAAGYWAPGTMTKTTCMTVLTPFMTRYGAGSWCGVTVETPGMFHAAQQFAAKLLPGGAFWETIGIFGTATTERYDIAARAVFVTVSALVVIVFGSWTSFFTAAGGRLRGVAGNALQIVRQYFTGVQSAEVALDALLKSTYQELVHAWTEQENITEDESFQACLAFATTLGATPQNLMNGGTAFGNLLQYVPVAADGVTQVEMTKLFLNNAATGGMGFSFSGEGDAPIHLSSSLPQMLAANPNFINIVELFLTNNDVAQTIGNIPAPVADLAHGARAKYMRLRSLLQLAAVTAGALARARPEPQAMSDATQIALQQAFQKTMHAYRDAQISSLLAAEDLAVIFAGNVGLAIMQGAVQSGGRRRRKTIRCKPRSKVRRKKNQKKTRVGKRRTRRH